jgi:CBS domain-containing protein
MKVREAMHQGVEWVEPGTTVEVLAQRMREHDIDAIPIGENDRLVGMMTDRDIVVRGLSKDTDCSSLTARDVMTEGVVFCRDAEEADDAVRIMEQKEIRRLPVLDENKRMVGMLSLGDVSHETPHEVAGEVTAAVSDHHA